MTQETHVNVTFTKLWWVKWSATIVILLAVMCRSVDEVPKLYDVSLSFVGTMLWLYVSIVWKDRSLIVLNTALSLLLGSSLLRYAAMYFH